ncbi:MAG: ATP-binding cassette domain-containing protein [Actinobacteria bacterium]|nr:ATP-binding cassette domain-containing protein [Actinomycetota bacterium]
MNSIIAHELVKTYDKGAVRALDGLNLDVKEGTVLGLLGPNGSGKTTTVRVLATLLTPDSGSATVAGIDVLKHPDEVRKVIGLSGQYAALDETLTGWDNLNMFGRLYHLNSSGAKKRAEELLEKFSLTEAAKRPIRTYSGGMRRRLDLAASLIVKPKVLFLDEPTTGLDPRGRMEMWEVIDDELKNQVGGERLEITVEANQIPEATKLVEQVTGTKPSVDNGIRKISAPVSNGSASLIQVLRLLDDAKIHPLDIGLKRPSLDDVFIALTGHVAEVVVEGGANVAKRK